MYAYGIFFDRYNLTQKIDFLITQEQCEKILDKDGDTIDVIGTGITAFVTETSLRENFDDINNLMRRAKKGKPIVLDDEESLIVIAGTREEARRTFLKMRALDLEDEFT